MTGRGRGFCVLKLPNGPGEPIAGLAGRVGRPLGQPLGPEKESAHLRRQAEQIEAVLRMIRTRIRLLEADRRPAR